jgi:multiple sugar transport system substrate-binding protein
MKKVLSMLLVALLLGGAVFANGTSEVKKDDISASPITIKYAFWGNPDAIGVEKDIIDAFEASHPNIKVEPVVSGYSDYHSKLMTMMAGGISPDVMRIDSYYFADFSALDAVENLEPYIAKSNFDVSIYPVAAIKEATVNGKLSALPWSTAPLYFILNLNAFEKAGIALPSYDWTVDEFYEIIRQFNGSKTGCYGFAPNLNDISNILPLMWATGGNLLSDDRNTFTLDQPNSYENIQKLANLYQQGYLPKDSITADTETLIRWFTNDSIAIMQASVMEILSVQKVEGTRFEAWPAPGGAVANTTVYKSNEICMSTDSKHKEASWEFMQFLRGNKGEKLYVGAHRCAPMLLNDDTLWPTYMGSGKYPSNIQEATGLIATKFGHQLPLRKGYNELVSLVVPVVQKILMGNVTAQKGMEGISDKAADIIARNSK